MEAETLRLIAGLESEFKAAVAADEDAAAWDLAFSLGQDLSVVDEILRDGGHLLVAGARVSIDAIGHNFIEGGGWIVPLDRALVSIGDGSRPRDCADVLLGLVRAMARAKTEIVVGAGGSTFHGQVRRATTEHVVLGDPPMAVPWSEVRYIRRVRVGSADAL